MIFFKNKNPYKIDSTHIKAYNKIRPKEKVKLFCQAPFHSLVFSNYGKVLACFYNKREPLGIYPTESIHEIWFGKKIKKLRKYLKHYDLRYGCDDCLRQINKGNYYSVGAWRYDYLDNKPSKYPTSFEFQISNNCNLQCIMCNGELSNQIRINREKEHRYENPYDDIFIEQLKEFIPHLREASFTGGETFLIPIYYKIWDLMYKINPDIEISVSTNCTILNDRVKNYLSKLRFKFSVSIDAVDEDIYKNIRIGATLNNTLENFKYFLEYTKTVNTSINVKVCPLRNNIYHIPKLLEYFNSYNVAVIFNNVFFPPSVSLWNLPSSNLKDIISFLRENQALNRDKDIVSNWKRYDNLINQISNWKSESIIREKNINEFTGTSEKLEAQLQTNISKYIETIQYYKPKEKEEKTINYQNKIKQIFNAITEEEVKIKTLFYLLNLPIDRILGEVEFRDIDKLIDRFIQSANYNKEL